MDEPPRKADGFGAYYAATESGAPRATLLRALDAFAAEPAPSAPRLALDLGCGTGRDTVEMLRRGWRVLAIDSEPEAIAGLCARPEAAAHAARLETKTARFEDTDLPAADLVNSSFALPLCAPEAFPRLWEKIVGALSPGGRFAGQFYGPRDTWAKREPPITIHDGAALAALFRRFDLAWMMEEETDAVTPRGQPKHWHVFHVVARKLPDQPAPSARR